MPFVVNSNATILCAHGGRVQIAPRQTTVLVGGAPAVRESDLVGAPIIGCAQPPSPGSKPCTVVVAVIPMSGSAPRVTAGGMPLHTDTLTGPTDGVPPGVIQVLDPGQRTVQASV